MKAVLLIAHGTVDSLEDLPRFLANIRRGQPAPDELVHEVRRRYQAIGGRSPLNEVNRSLASKLEVALGVPVRLANRLWEPYPGEVLGELSATGVTGIAAVPLAQHSAAVYEESVREAVSMLEKGGSAHLALACSGNWGRVPALIEAYAASLRAALGAIPQGEKARIVMTAHSLPLFVVRGGDPYESEARAAAELVAGRLGAGAPEHVIAFQSQGMSGPGPGGRPVEWLGPDLVTTLDAAKKDGVRHLVVAPLGFLADHVEILYDLDLEARALGEERGIRLHRTASLNDSDALVGALADVARPLLGGLS